MKDINLLVQNGVDLKSSLELFGDIETYNDTLEDFLNDIDAKTESLSKAKEIADMANYAIYVHSLKSDAKYFGFTALAEMAYHHEMESKANHMYYIYDHYNELVDEIHRVIRVVQKYLGKEAKVQEEVRQETSNLKILVVDDSNVIRNFIKTLFHTKYQVLVALDGNDALQMIAQEPQDQLVVMLLDLNMPNVNGFEVLNYFKEHQLFEKIPVAIITGVADENVLEQLEQYPILGIIEKPFNEKNIKDIIEKAMKNKN